MEPLAERTAGVQVERLVDAMNFERDAVAQEDGFQFAELASTDPHARPQLNLVEDAPDVRALG